MKRWLGPISAGIPELLRILVWNGITAAPHIVFESFGGSAVRNISGLVLTKAAAAGGAAQK